MDREKWIDKRGVRKEPRDDVEKERWCANVDKISPWSAVPPILSNAKRC